MTTEQKPKTGSKGTSDKLYGKRTLGVLVQQALAQAGITHQEGTSKSTDYFRALIDQKVRQASGRFKLALVAVAIGAFALLSFVGVLIFRSDPPSLTNNGIESTGKIIASTNRYNIFMLAGTRKDGTTSGREGFCSAFSVSSDVLATCAHCVADALNNYDDVIAVMNGASENQFNVVDTASHPGFEQGRISPDVGLIQIDRHLPYFSRMAPDEDLQQLAPGDAVYLYGFPGRLADVRAPEATFVQGDLGRLTTLKLGIATPQEHLLLQHSAFTSSGTSGSPLFNAAGHVIGINTGGYKEGKEKLVGYNVALRIDLLNQLLADF